MSIGAGSRGCCSSKFIAFVFMDYTELFKLPVSVVDFAVQEGNLNLSYTVGQLNEADRKSTVLLSCLIAAVVALGGALTVQMLDGPCGWRMAVVETVAIIALSASCVVLVFGCLFRTSKSIPGESPQRLLPSENIEWLAEMKDSEQAEICIKAWRLATIDKAIEYNYRELARRVRMYRAAVLTLISGMAIDAAVILILFLAG